MRKEEMLDAAKATVATRGDSYGTPLENMRDIAELWSMYLPEPVDAWEVPILNMLQKIARLRKNKGDHQDSWIDIAGYAAVGSEVMHDLKLQRDRLHTVKERIAADLGIDLVDTAAAAGQTTRGPAPKIKLGDAA